jgi:transposase, IS30 family
MRLGRRAVMTGAQREELWRRYKAGETVLGIGRALSQRPTTIHRVLQATGGIGPAQRHRSARVLSFAEREEISRGICAGHSFRAIARNLQRAASTVSQEAVKLKQDWSPQQIAGWLRDQYPGRPELWVSHETIYRSLFVQARGALKQELIGHLRSKRRVRRSRHATDRGLGRGEIADAISIRQRPAEAEDRAVPGHWEGDLVEGSRGTYIATLVERRSRFVILVKLPEKKTEAVVAALIKAVRRLPTALRKSLTWDRGMELANHAQFTVATDVQVFFCDPYSPWQRGSNENTNGLLRQYYPKGVDLSSVSQAQLDAVAKKLNTRPRKTLQWKTPADIFDSSVSMVH